MKTLFLSCLFSAVALTTHAATFFQPKITRSQTFITLFSSGPETKLSPELEAVVASRIAYAGVNQNGSILRAEDASAERRLKDNLPNSIRPIGEHEGTTSSGAVLPPTLLVRLNLPAPPTGAFAGFAVVGTHLRDKNSYIALSKPEQITAEDLDQLVANPVVAYIEPNYLYTTAARADVDSNEAGSVPSAEDHFFMQQWNLPFIGATELWKIKAERIVRVAVIDSGVDAAHEDLRDRVIAGKNVLTGTSDVTDEEGHGTHCAGIIAAGIKNGKGIAGVAPRTEILPIKIFGKNDLGPTALQLVQSIDFAIDSGAEVINASWGGPILAAGLVEVLKKAHARGVFVVAAAGNNSQDTDTERVYPSSLEMDNIISVMAVDRSGERWSRSNFGKDSVYIAAPGVDILSTLPGGIYGLRSGTSMAAPHVTAVVATLLSAHKSRADIGSQPDHFVQIRSQLFKMGLPSPFAVCATKARLFYSSQPARRDAVKRTVFTGFIKAGSVRPGAETSGIYLSDQKSGHDIQLLTDDEDLRSALTDQNGKQFIISGRTETVEGAETGTRAALRIDSAQSAAVF